MVRKGHEPGISLQARAHHGEIGSCLKDLFWNLIVIKGSTRTPMPVNEYPDSPQIAVGAVVFRENRVLLVKRNQLPGKGLWAIPGGRLELGETLKEAAQREVREETGVIIRAGDPVYTFDLIERDDQGRIRFHYVIVDLLADYISGNPHPRSDACEARWIAPRELEELPVTKSTRAFLKEKIKFG